MSQPKFNIKDESQERKYFSIVPNYIVNHSTLEERGFYLTLKRIAGEYGTVRYSARDLGKMWLEKETRRYINEHREGHHKQMQDLLAQKKHIESDDLNKAFNQRIPRNAFRLEILRFLKKYKIPYQWEEITRHYLLFNKHNDEWMPINSVTLQENWDFDLGGWQLTLILSADTTLEDIKAIWPLVKEQQSKLYDHPDKKFQPIPNLKIDERVYMLKQQKMTNSSIANEINKEFPYLSYTYKDVSDSLRRHKQRLRIV